MKKQRFRWTKNVKKVCLSCGKVYYVNYNNSDILNCKPFCESPLAGIKELIYLEKNKENLFELLKNVFNATSPYTHQQICAWCRRFPHDERVWRIFLDISSKWDMYLANIYTLKELQQLDFSKVNLPIEWFENWLLELSSQTPN